MCNPRMLILSQGIQANDLIVVKPPRLSLDSLQREVSLKQ